MMVMSQSARAMCIIYTVALQASGSHIQAQKAPTEPGRYVVTVVTIGGNYQAAPITRSFQIVK